MTAHTKTPTITPMARKAPESWDTEVSSEMFRWAPILDVFAEGNVEAPFVGVEFEGADDDKEG